MKNNPANGLGDFAKSLFVILVLLLPYMKGIAQCNEGNSVEYASTSTAAANYLFAYPVTVSTGGLLTAIGTIGKAPASGASIKMALYTNNGGAPGNFIVGASTGMVIPVGTFYQSVTPTLITPGSYWIVWAHDFNAKLAYATTGGPILYYHTFSYSNSFPANYGVGSTVTGQLYNMLLQINCCTGGAPVIGACPANIVQCTPVATWTNPTSTGTSPVIACSPASGSTFPAGATTTVTCTSTNACGSTSCSFSVTINNSPVIAACPANISQCNAVITWTNPTATGLPAPTVVCTPASGSAFPLGNTLVSCTATNSCGSSSCTFNVENLGSGISMGACPANILQCNNPVASWTNPVATGSPAPSVACSPASGTTFPSGTTTVTCTATNTCGSTNCSFNVTINTGPIIPACPANISQCNAVATWVNPIATGFPAPTVICSPLSGSSFPIGNTLVTCNATNSCGSSSCSFNVERINGSLSLGACPANISQCNPVVTWASPVATGSPTATVVCSPASGSTFPTGNTTITCSATNLCGSVSCSFSVNINAYPSITCPSNISQFDNHVATWTAPVATGGASVSCSPASGSTFPAGVNTVTCTATINPCGSTSCSFTVTINETTAGCDAGNSLEYSSTSIAAGGYLFAYPVTVSTGGMLTAIGTIGKAPASGARIKMALYTNSGGAPGNFIVGAASETVIPVGTFYQSVTPTLLTPGSYWIVWTNDFNAKLAYATTGGPILYYHTFSYSNSFPVNYGGGSTVTGQLYNMLLQISCCTTLPVISSCPGNILQCNNHIASWTNPTATGSPSPTVFCSPSAGSVFPTGTTLVTCNAANGCGTSYCTFNVTINESPVISACPANIMQCDNPVVTWSNPTATGSTSQTVVCSPASGSTFPLGATTVTCTAANSCGSSSCTFNVTINATPVIGACPSNITQCNNNVNYTPPSATATPAATMVCSPASGSTFASGTTVVNCTATNYCGSASCTFNVTINTGPSPTITGNLAFCSGSTTTLNAGAAYSSYSWSTGATTQTLSVNTANTFTVTVQNANGCTGSTSVTTTVTSPVVPVITAGGPIAFCNGGSVTLTASASAVQDLSFTTLNIGTLGTDQWQSFIPTMNGLITAIQVQVNGTQTVSGTLSIYTGTGTGGTLIHSQTYSGNFSTGFTSFNLPGINLTAGNTYTFRLQGTNFSLAATNSGYGTYFSNSYGTPGWRLIFKTFMIPAFGNLQWYESGNSIGGATATSYVAVTGGSYTCKNAVGSCMSAASNAIAVNINPMPPPAITGSTSFCDGGSTTLDAGSGYSNYIWSTGETSQTISVNTATTVTVTVTNGNGCTGIDSETTTINPLPVIGACPSDIIQCNNHIVTWNDPAATGGGTLVCLPASGSTFSAGTTSVTCTATNGCGSSDCAFNVTINESAAIGTCPSDFITCNPVVTYTTPASTGFPASPVSCSPASGSTFSVGTTTVNCTATNFCATSSCTFNVTVNTISTAAANVTSSALYGQVCSPGTVTLTANGGSLGTGADWKWYDGGCGSGAFVGSGASLTLAPSVGSHNYFVRAESACGNTACQNVTVSSINAPPSGTVHYTTSLADGCVGSVPSSISINAVPNCTFYRWTSNEAGVRFNGNPGPYETTVPTVNLSFTTLPAAGSSGWSICVFGGNACGNTNSICTWVRAIASMPTSITGSVIGCPGSAGNIYSSAAVAGAASYQWSASSGITVNSNGSQTITVDFSPGFVSGTLNVHAQTACGYNGANKTITISRAPTIPGTISGTSYPCPNAIATYNVTAVPGAANYTWTTSVPGAVVTGTTNTCSILFPATIPAGSTVSVISNSSCPFSSAVRSKGIANGLPNIPGNIIGPANGQCGQSGVSYSVAPVSGASGYFWSANNGAVISGPNNLSGVSINFPAAFTTVTLSNYAINNCGNSLTRTLVISGGPSQPGVISGNQSVCLGSVETYATGGSMGATSYNWFCPAGSTILNSPPYGSSVLIQWGSTGGNVVVSASNACGTSTTRTLPVSITCRQSQVSGAKDQFVSLYPNPTNGITTLSFESTLPGKFEINIADITGRIIRTDFIVATDGMNVHEFDFALLPKGIYFIVLKNEMSRRVEKMVIE